MEFAARSPLNYVANVKTPTMVMTGEAERAHAYGPAAKSFTAR